MLLKVLRILFLSFFSIFAATGYLYFGQSQISSELSKLGPFRLYIAPIFDRLLSMGDSNTMTIGSLLNSSGELNFRSPSELVFQPAREGQRFPAGTLISSGDTSRAVIAL